MTHDLTPEQIQKNKKQAWFVTGFMVLVFLGMGLFFTYPTFLKGMPFPPNFWIFWLIMGVLLVLSVLAGMSGVEKKRVTQVEVTPQGLALISKNGRDEVPYASIQKLHIGENPQGEVLSLFLHAEQRRPVILLGYTAMTKLADELEKKVPKATNVERRKVKATPQRKAMGLLLVLGMVVGFLVIFGGGFYLMIKLGLGPLALPACLTLSGILKFASSRGVRKDRLTGIALIFFGLLYGALKIFEAVIQKG